MAANGISTATYKLDRQLAKLSLAAADKAAQNLIEPGRYVDITPDITQLPTQYATNTNVTSLVVDNANTGGLKVGRPWAP